MTTVCFLIALLCLVMYVVLDGYDLGIGIATLVEPNARHRHEMLEQVAQAWDGNETWLVLLGVSIWAGFPLAFGTLLPHAYLPLIVMLFSLIVRGVSVEMASQARPAPRWERAFGVASLVAALAQGVALATLTANVKVVDGAFSGTPFGAISAFSALSALTVACCYLALGYAYTRGKATGDLRVRAGRRGTISAVLASTLVAASLVAASRTDAPLDLHDHSRALALAGLLLVATVGLVTGLLTMRPASSYDGVPFGGLATAVVAVLVALVVARYPVLAPPGLTLDQAVGPDATTTFIAIGIGLNVPLVLYNNWFAHHALRGKLTGGPAPHDVPAARTGAGHDH
jgi:cytochrome bd ubiquinol oxidase subunit II